MRDVLGYLYCSLLHVVEAQIPHARQSTAFPKICSSPCAAAARLEEPMLVAANNGRRSALQPMSYCNQGYLQR